MDLAQEVVLNSDGEPIDIEFNYPKSEELHKASVLPREGIRKTSTLHC